MSDHVAIPDGALEGRTVLVTGAARGIGRSAAMLAAKVGATVVALDIRHEVRELDDRPHVRAVVADAADVHDMQRVVHDLEADGIAVDSIVTAAGLAEFVTADTPVGEAAASFARMIEGNLTSCYVAVRSVFAHLIRSGRANVVIVSTDHVHVRPGATPKSGFMEGYDAAKWGLEGLRRNWSTVLGRHGGKANIVAMGETDTPMLREFMADRGTTQAEMDERSVAEGWLTSDGVGSVIVALLADVDPRRTDTNVGLWPGFPVALPPLD
jgi:NAD(P)-dependent dehydrogenase (short-subunit alcohol dehydrogenase family)